MEQQKAWMTAKEELFIISLLCSNVRLSPKSTALVRCVAALFPHRCRLLEKKKNNDIFIKKLQAKTIGGNQASISGEDSVNNLVLNLLKRKHTISTSYKLPLTWENLQVCKLLSVIVPSLHATFVA
jgi:hypothetical protein